MRRRRITTASEALAEYFLERTLKGTGWRIALKLPIQDVLDKETEFLDYADFDLYRSGHFDFTVYPEIGREAVFVIEFDDYGHDRPEQIARDLIKNRFCSATGLPLLRIGRQELRQQERVSVLEWLLERFVTWQDWDPKTIGADARQQNEMPGVIKLERAMMVHVLHPFPANIALAARLLSRFGITSRLKEFELFRMAKVLQDHWLVGASERMSDEAPYVLEVEWPGELATFEDGVVSEYLASKVGVGLRARNADTCLFRTTGEARFAWAHKTEKSSPVPPHPLITSAEQLRALGLFAPDLPWLDASAIANELEIYDAMSKVERWAARSLASADR